ncbi:Elongation factor 2 [Lobosporangium transversale]|nr:Elongation factor 2 [Lobosporangium transversale]
MDRCTKLRTSITCPLLLTSATKSSLLPAPLSLRLVYFVSSAHASEMGFTGTRQDEQKRAIVIESIAVSLLFEMNEDGLPDIKQTSNGIGFLINPTDASGQADFSSKAIAALHVMGSAVVVVNCVRSVCILDTNGSNLMTNRTKGIAYLSEIKKCHD